MRAYLTLLRLPYQFQLGPIFGWGYLLAGGQLKTLTQLLHFTVLFLIFHIGAFGGLTALNSYYDRDIGPIGGLWQPPAPPAQLCIFAWMIQLGGLLLLAAVDLRLTPVYATILLLSLGYSHPRWRWKGHAWKSLVTVAIGQGILDFTAGAAATQNAAWPTSVWWGMAGATLTIIGFYPLTQIYQVQDDQARGDQTLASLLVHSSGRSAVFSWATIFLGGGALSNAVALFKAGNIAGMILILAAGTISLLNVQRWSRIKTIDPRDDFQQVHRHMLLMSLAFGIYVMVELVLGGLV